MKYLFFDVECSNCHDGVGKLCEFGYVITDENFNVLSKDDIPMSPGKGKKNAFDLTGRKNEKDLELAYDYEYYYAQPEFPHFYERIKKLMESKDTICFAYSMGNDIRHINSTCERYKMPPLNYICYDVQMLAGKYLEQKKQIKLENACLEIVGPHSLFGLQPHLSRDDAMMERMIFEAICILEKEDSQTMLSHSDYAKANSIEFIKNFREHARIKALIKAGHDLYRSLLCEESELDKEENIGRRYNISAQVKKDMPVLKEVIKLIKERNGLFCDDLSKTDFFIVYDEKNKEEIKEKLRSPFNGQMITYQEFIK